MKIREELLDYRITVKNYDISFKCKFEPNSTELVLFLHGLACSHNSFGYLLQKDYFPGKSFILIDLIGYGESSKPDDFSYTMKDQAKIIEKLLSLLPEWKNIHLVAHSMGAAIALLLSEETHQKVKSFSNIEGNLIAEDCGMMSRGISEKSLEEYEKGLYKMHLFSFGKHPQIRMRQTTALAVYKSAVSLVAASDNGKLLEKFRDLNCKKAYFYGEENQKMPVLQKLDFAKKLMIPNSGHAMTSQNPEEFFEKLAGFIG